MELEKIYDPVAATKWYKIWEDASYFKPSYLENAPSYAIVLPPPNVTGTLHMGHGFQHTIMDILIRYHRMSGFNTLWQPGTDHAGIATQIVVERQLEQQGTSREELGREEFIRRVWQWKEFSGNTITQQMRKLGVSCDWSRERFTMDAGLSNAVNEVFVSLYEQGYIYRGNRLVNWDVQLQTAVSDLEVVNSEEEGSLWHIRYPVKDSNESLIVATTRPETMLGDMAVAINPDDERYQHLLGKMVILPLVEREIPIIADEYVDISFGTGCVKITPAHDFNDYQVAKRHNLPLLNILTLDGHINSTGGNKYQNLERFVARKQIVDDLEKSNYLVAIKPHRLQVPRSERTGVIIEPMLTNQWFMTMDKLAQNAMALVQNGKTAFIPENWCTTYEQWLKNIQDWCISRQLWWGHRIPAYYVADAKDGKNEKDGTDGKIYVARDLATARQMAGTDNLIQDEDVLDTWFSAALWCFSSLGWPEANNDLETFLPTSVLVTGFDIIFFWVARMIMLTNKFMHKVPFKQVYITGLIQDAHGNKMSKSKGNIIDPIDLINGISLDDLLTKRTQNLLNPKQAEAIIKQTKRDYPDGFAAFGADALRFTFALLATYGREIRFEVKRIESSRNFCNKLWNAARFVLMQVQQATDLIVTVEQFATLPLTLLDEWMLIKLKQVITEVKLAYATYRFDLLAQKLYDFVWNDYCSWYLELAKVNMTADDKIKATGTINTLLTVLEVILRLLHPLMPFITEELWQVVAPLGGRKTHASIMLAHHPKADDLTTLANLTNQDAVLNSMELLQNIVTQVRNLRANMNLNPGVKVPLIVVGGIADTEILAQLESCIMSLCKLSNIVIKQSLDAASSNAPKALVGKLSLMLQVTVDQAEEKLRITAIIAKYTKELEKLSSSLNNPAFIARAPKEIVARDRARAEELKMQIATLQQELVNLER